MEPSRDPRTGTSPSCHDLDSPVHPARAAIAAGLLTAMSGRDDVGGRQQATARASFPVAQSVLRFGAVFLTLATGLTMMSLGCVLPLAPNFDDPPAERNYAPTLVDFTPAQGFVSPGPLTVTVSDPNVGDDLVVRWIVDYPPYNADRTRSLNDDPIPHSADGKPLLKTSPRDISCLNLAQGVSAHPVTALIADRAFLCCEKDDGANLSAEQKLTKLPPNALSVEAHWVVNAPCGQ